MAIIPLSVLNWYPLVGERDTPQQIKTKFLFSKADENLLERLNYRFREVDWINAQAGSYLREPPEELSKKQIRLLSFVKLSRFMKEYEKAASNAISILWATGFSLSCLKLQETALPEAKLAGAPLDDADLSQAKLEKVDLALSSLNRTTLAGTKPLNFGQYPTLKHKREILGMASTSNDHHLFSFDEEALYKWELSTGKLLYNRRFSKSYPESGRYYHNMLRSPILISKNGRFLLLLRSFGRLEVFDSQSLSLVKTYDSGVVLAIYFALILENRLLIAVTRSEIPDAPMSEVVFWKFDANSATDPLQGPCQKIEIKNSSFSYVCLSSNDKLLMAAYDNEQKRVFIYCLPDEPISINFSSIP
jgi:hypothetical protein